MSTTPEPPEPADPTSSTDPAPARQRRTSVLVGALVGLLVLAVVAAGFAGWSLTSGDDPEAPATSPGTTPRTPSPTASGPEPGTDPELARFYAQEVRWQDCGRAECGRLTVPLDYEAPDATTIELAVLKVPAQDDQARVGALVVNPGGPGGSGVNYAAAGSLQFGRPLSQAFDIVGFDPRGVGQSSTLECLTTGQLDTLVAFDPDPDDLAERNDMDRLIHGFGQGCLDRSGDITRHMSTREVVRDLDILRAALDEPKLHYLGASYGTLIGATYADMFPDRVGRFVLDGAIDPSLSNEELTLSQAGGFETALRAYVKDCVDRGGCFLGDSVDEGTRRIRDLLDQIERQPLPTDTDRDLTVGTATLGVWLPLYLKEYWPQLTAGLQQAMDDRRGSALLGLADLYTSRGPSGYTDNSIEALYAVNCLDHNDFIPTSEVPSHFAEFEKVSPTFGRAFAFGLSTCSSWPVKSGQRTTALHAAGAAPIVVIGTTRDPATPLAWAQAMAAQLESGRLITRDGDGHTGFQRGNDCVDDAVETWLIDGDAPPPNLMC
ncbi:MAG TPA: alpha/beta hydrolase [Marmoricola sp.]